MKISIVGPGLMPIPPKGWGAVESLIWDMANALKELGHSVQIINTTDGNKVLQPLRNMILTSFISTMTTSLFCILTSIDRRR